jgi:hypothetical protein
MITSVVCPGGWHYPQVLSSGDTVRITGFSFEQLLENMLEFRRRHLELCGAESARIESVRTDLKKYLCAHFRQNCADSNSTPMVQTGGIGITNYERPIDRAGNWFGKLSNQTLEKVDAALAAERAHICATFPQNVRWATPCGPCNDNILVRIQNAKGSVHTPYDRNLFLCRVFGHVNEVAVWLADTHSEEQSQPPAVCWMPKNHG